MMDSSFFDKRRRAILQFSALLGAIPLTSACGGGSSDPEPLAGAPSPSPSPSPAPPPLPTPTPTPTPAPTPAPATPGSPVPPGVIAVVSGRYRPGQKYLFQSISVPKYFSSLGGGDYNADVWGPTHQYVDFYGNWRWVNPGGDWLDSTGAAQGTSSFAKFRVDSAVGASAAFRYMDVDVTAAVQFCQVNSRWLALYLVASGAARAIASTFSKLGQGPNINVTYTDGSSAQLSCRLVAISTPSSSLPITVRDSMGLPCFVEFERPAKAVASAKLSLTVTEHWSGGAAFVSVFICNPPINTVPDTGQTGLASRAGVADSGIASIPGVIGAQRYVEGTTLSNFAKLGVDGSISSEPAYDPALWGGVSNVNKFPHTVVGKWVNVPPGLSLVDSNYRGEGFEPLSPGLGALKLVMEDGNKLTGQEVGYAATTAINARLFMPFEEMGLLDHIFVRQYVRFGTPHIRQPSDRREVLQGGRPVWSAMGGKFGIAPSHVTSYGGNSGSSGGGFGWQMRWAWSECECGTGGPNEAGAQLGWHLYDFQNSNPTGHRYGGESQNTHNWGQIGGQASVLYGGFWYCIETELKLNSVNASNNTYLADGLIRTWVDGKLCYERTGMVFRTLPLHMPAFNDVLIRPFRQLGIKELWWNWYNGGTTPSTVQRTAFTTGLVWARERIGPMN